MIPPKVKLGQHYNIQISSIIRKYEIDGNRKGTVMGYKIPDFQRPLVWSKKQKIKLIESLFLGLPIGTFTVNEINDYKFDSIIIDGQQRMNAIQEYIENKLKVYDLLYSEVNQNDKARFRTAAFPQYVTNSDDIEYLKNYYNLMNFGGTAHKESERA
jgi:uncharacterized protein with ParB-like and HNH nuclease domain